MTRVAITGDRHWRGDRYSQVRDALATLGAMDVVVLGDARGVDRLARAACEELDLPHEVHVADWARYGRGAGPVRNGQMLDAGGGADEVWYFHDHIERSRGTWNCCRQAQERGIKVRDGREVA